MRVGTLMYIGLAVLGLIAAIIGAIAWRMRRAAAKRMIQEFDQGTRCIVCHKTNMQVVGSQARCNDCLHISDLAALQAGVVSDAQIAAATATRNRE